MFILTNSKLFHKNGFADDTQNIYFSVSPFSVNPYDLNLRC